MSMRYVHFLLPLYVQSLSLLLSLVDSTSLCAFFAMFGVLNVNMTVYITSNSHYPRTYRHNWPEKHLQCKCMCKVKSETNVIIRAQFSTENSAKFRGPQASLQNSVAYRDKIVQISRFTTAIRVRVN